MLLEVKRDVTIIPTAAIQRGTQGTFVYVVQADNTVTMRPIKLGPTEGESLPSTAGSRPGSRWSSTAATSCAKAPRWNSRRKTQPRLRRMGLDPKHGGRQAAQRRRRHRAAQPTEDGIP